MKKTIKNGYLLLLCLIGWFAIAPHQVQGASRFEVINVYDSVQKVGNVTFSSKQLEVGGWRQIYYKKGSVKKRLATDERISTIILTDGKKAYYSVQDSSGMDDCCSYTIYEKNLSTGNAKKIFSLSNIDYFNFEGYYQSKIYYVKELDPGTLCFYDLKTGKSKEVLSNVTGTQQYGNVFLCTPYEGAGGPLPLQIYNAKNNKAKLLTNNMIYYRVIDKKVYYVDCIEEYDFGNYLCNVVRCDLSGKNRRVVAQNQRIKGFIEKMTASYITYKDYDTGKSHKITYKKST